jgi:hypothetical protein
MEVLSWYLLVLLTFEADENVPVVTVIVYVIPPVEPAGFVTTNV